MRGFFKRLKELWLVAGITILLLIIIELFFIGYFKYVNFDDPRKMADCYNDAEWVDEYFAEFNSCNTSNWEPYVYWKRAPFSGNYININEDGIRNSVVTTHPFSKDDPEIKIFFMGGSALWGTGVEDAFTIPSITGNELAKHGYNIQVTNFGESGYVSTQEVIKLILELRKGNVPDYVVFYDGANDIFSSLQNGIAGIPQNESNRSAEFNTLKEKKKSLLNFFHSLGTLATIKFIKLKFGQDISFKEYTPAELKILAANTVNLYNENIRAVHALGKQYGFQTIFYWQPTIFDKPILSSYEKAELKQAIEIKSFVKEAHLFQFSDDLIFENIRFYNLSNIFNEIKEPLFIDWCHLAEKGNILISKRMTKDLLPMVDSLYNGNTRFDEQN